MKKKESLMSRLRAWRLKHLRERLKQRRMVEDLKTKASKASTSLLWVWEFSKKAVRICFLLYVIVQLYTMAVMWRFMDFSSLPTLIEQTAMILRDCVFAYLIKSGLENVPKIWLAGYKPRQKSAGSDGDEPAG